jgi:hypothetical protein
VLSTSAAHSSQAWQSFTRGPAAGTRHAGLSWHSVQIATSECASDLTCTLILATALYGGALE